MRNLYKAILVLLWIAGTAIVTAGYLVEQVTMEVEREV